MKKVIYLYFGASVGFALGFKLISTAEYGGDSRFLLDLGFALVFFAFLVFLFDSVFLATRLSSGNATLAGIAFLAATCALWLLIAQSVSIHAWTFVLLSLPVTSLLSGALLFVVGAIRLARQRFRRPLPRD